MKYSIYALILIALMLVRCSTKDNDDVSSYYDVKEQDEVLTTMVTYLFSAPPYTSMESRFEDRHRPFYSTASSRFSIVKYFIAEDDTHYFYVLRPSSDGLQQRGVGGHFKMKDRSHLTDFREEFVTQAMSEADVRVKSAFLFDSMVKGDLEKYLEMESYVQWPNPATYYDTIAYEWKLKPGL